MSPRSDVAQRRGQILEATCEVLAERGFRELRIVDVAERVGYSTATIHYYFDSKDVLLEEAFRFQYEKSVARRESYAGDDDPVTRLHRLADGYLPSSQVTISAWRVWLELWVSALAVPRLAEINDVYYGEWRQTVLDAVVAGHEQGRLSVDDPVAFANAYVSMMDGLAIQVLIGSSHVDVERMRTTCAAFIDSAVIS